MKHDINKLISEYSEMFKRRPEPLVLTDVVQIYERVSKNGNIDTAVAIMDAMAAGYALGYKDAKREKRERG